ncbi:probable G-protein coupled receptor CG31760 [Homalodisca vitripennis]|uniref:probable G-protein coupled receptor CG31760 n=1 Tax=Homalodisca vitripennis TaxID=197043 RepID=UPI001EEB6EAB|nr:probable G-protein coupled receptor CG31760 [Homalodisca vitripennis]
MGWWGSSVLLGLLASLSVLQADNRKNNIEEALEVIHDISTGNMGTLCVSELYRSLTAHISPMRYDTARQKADLIAMLLQDLGIAHHNGLLDAVGRTLLVSDRHMLSTRVLALNASTGHLTSVAIWRKATTDSHEIVDLGARRVTDDMLRPGARPDPSVPWYEDAQTSPTLRSPKFMSSPDFMAYRGWWTFPYYSCLTKLWIMSYSVVIPPSPKHGVKGLLSFDVDVSGLEVNQCDSGHDLRQVHVFRGSHKCHNTTQCVYIRRGSGGWHRGSYTCRCKTGYYSPQREFNGTLVEAAWIEKNLNASTIYDDLYQCRKCAPGCAACKGPSPCLSYYNWPFRGKKSVEQASARTALHSSAIQTEEALPPLFQMTSRPLRIARPGPV